MLFSIVVPAFNVEKYLDECVRGILEQSCSKYEVILVDDGSTDGTGPMCDDCASRDDRVRVIHQSNGGLSDARNAGLREAQGDYLVFVDGDDTIMPDSLKSFSQRLDRRPDVLITRLVEVHPDSGRRKMDEKMREDFGEDKLSVMKWVFSESQNTWPSVKYVANRRFVLENRLQFAKGYLHEDIDWTSKLFRSATTFSFCCYFWYHHRINRSGAIGASESIKRTLDVIELVSRSVHDESFGCLDAEMRALVFRRLVSSLFSAVVTPFHRYDSEEKREVVAALSEHEDLFEYAVAPEHRMFVALARAIGLPAALEITSDLNAKLIEMKRRAR